MNKIKNVFSKNKYILIQYAINLVITYVFWGSLLRTNYNADTLECMFNLDADVYWNCAGGRFLKSLFDFILLKAGFRFALNTRVAHFIALLIIPAGMTSIQNLFAKWAPDEIFIKTGYYGATSLVFLNVLFMDNLMFPECVVYFAASYLLTIIAVKKYVSRKYVTSLAILFVAVCFYQFSAVLAATIALAYIFIDEELKLRKQLVFRSIKAVLACASMGALNVAITTVLEKVGIFDYAHNSVSLKSLPGNLILAFNDFIYLNKSAYGMLYSFCIPGIITIVVLALAIASFMHKREYDKCILLMIFLFVSVLMLYALPVVNIEFRFPGRLAFVYFLIQGMMIVIAVKNTTVNVQKIIAVVTFTYLFIQCVFASFAMNDRFVSNTLDEVYAMQLVNEIHKYEETTGIEVTKLATCTDLYAPNYYEQEEFYYISINERIMTRAPRRLIQYVSGIFYEKVSMVEEVYEKYFEGRDWDTFDLNEQLVIIGDTAYWCIF